jgi:hypothetical protein
MTNQKYFAGLIDLYYARGEMGIPANMSEWSAGDLTLLRESFHMADTWEWLRGRLCDDWLSYGWERDEPGYYSRTAKTPEDRFFVFLDHMLLAARGGYAQERYRGDQRRQQLDEIRSGREAVSVLRYTWAIHDLALLAQIDEDFIERERSLRNRARSSPHVTFMAEAAQMMRFLTGSPHYEHIANMTNALFEVGVSADAARQAETRGGPNRWDPDRMARDEKIRTDPRVMALDEELERTIGIRAELAARVRDLDREVDAILTRLRDLHKKIEAEMGTPDKTAAEMAAKCPTDKTSSK